MQNTTRTPTRILASLTQKPLWPVPQLVVWSAHSSCVMETFIHYHMINQYLIPLSPSDCLRFKLQRDVDGLYIQ